MDRQLLERMVGAAVLVIALILLAPLVLDGPDDAPSTEAAGPDGGPPLRTVTLRPDAPASRPPVAQPVGGSTPAAPVEAPAQAPPAVTAAPPATPDAPAPAPRPEPRSEPRPAPPPAAQAAAQPPPAKPAPAPVAPTAPSGWSVQLGSFASEANARRLARKARDAGFESYLLPLERDGRTLHRVRVGPAPTREAATALARRLAGAGYPGQVTAPEPAG